MKIRRIIMVCLAVEVLSACSLPYSELKSPCVGADGNPCGPRRSVNEWWMNHSENS